MEPREHEEIPWANLISTQSNSIDKRVYAVIGVVGVLVVGVLAFRLLGGSPQPIPKQPVLVEQPQVTVIEQTPSTSMVIAEEDLRAGSNFEAEGLGNLAEVTAEWFITDWFTRDGSDETILSIMDLLSPELRLTPIPHETDGIDATFVEWAKTVETYIAVDGQVGVTVLFRSIRETKDGFVREPVTLVDVLLVRSGDVFLISALPTVVR